VEMRGLRPFSRRYEAELEILVRAAWKNIKIVPIKIQVRYPENRITHFRRGWDFARISILNSLFCFFALIYGYPCKFIRKFISNFS